MNYIIYGTSISGYIGFELLRKNNDVIAFIDKKGIIINKNIPYEYNVYKKIEDINKSIMENTDAILIGIGDCKLANEIKIQLQKYNKNIIIETVFEEKYVGSYEFIKDKILNDEKLIEHQVPKVFAIETVLGCNLSCPECAIGGNIINRKCGFLTFEKFKIIANKIRPFSEYLYLHLWGEPMLNTEIIKMIKYASTFTLTNISTNANTLNEDLIKELVTSGVSDLIISIDGVTQSVYEKYRVKGDLKKVIENLKLIKKYNDLYGGNINILPQFIVFKHNEEEIEEFKILCKDIGVDPVFKTPYVREGSQYKNSSLHQYIRNSFHDEKSFNEGISECNNAKNIFTILLDGTVVACCDDHNGETSFGNIFKLNVLEVWNSEKYITFRKNILDRKGNEFCLKNCLSYKFIDKGNNI